MLEHDGNNDFNFTFSTVTNTRLQLADVRSAQVSDNVFFTFASGDDGIEVTRYTDAHSSEGLRRVRKNLPPLPRRVRFFALATLVEQAAVTYIVLTGGRD